MSLLKTRLANLNEKEVIKKMKTEDLRKEIPIHTVTIESVSAEERSNTVRIRVRDKSGNTIVLQWL